ncbi:MAG: hypothetical protein ABI729_06930 [Chitinophagales bacterium]
MIKIENMTKEEGINQVYNGGGHVVILGAGASIASTRRNPELNGKQLPSMDNFIDIVGLSDLVAKVPDELKVSNFEKLYSNLHNSDHGSPILNEIEMRIMDYFSDMKLPNVPTIYDYLVLSLRKKDMIATFNWDPFLYQAWARNGERFTKELPSIAFLHGNVAIGYNKNLKRSGQARAFFDSEKTEYSEPTKLLYPIERKNYTNDEYINMQWEWVKSRLKEDRIKRLTVFGYGAPVSDIEAVKLLNESWGTPKDRRDEQFEVIDIAPQEQLLERWRGFIYSHHYDIASDYFGSSLAFNPRRTAEDYFNRFHAMTPSEMFRDPNPVPQDFKTLEDLWDWHRPLIEAETV